MFGFQLRFTSAIAASIVAFAKAGTFKDDLGTEHTFKGKPKIVCHAQVALTLRKFGMTEDQIVGTYGAWSNRGSDMDFDNLSKGSSLPSEPTPEELLWLDTKVTNLNPDCEKPGGCYSFDVDILKEVNPDYVIFWGYNQSPFYFSDPTLIPNVTEAFETVYIEISQESGKGTVCTGDVVNGCHGKTMITLIKQWEALAVALGVELPASVEDDKEAMCEAATKFTASAKKAHERGVRVMAMFPKTDLFYIANPTGNAVLRMLEELGMPLMHPGGICDDSIEPKCSHSYFWENVPRVQYFTGCDPDKDPTASCIDNTLYPVDMVLYDQRVTITLNQNETLNRFINDPALVEGQRAYWPGAGLPHTYQHAAEILTILAPALDSAKRIHAATDCTPDVDVTSLKHAETPLGGGKYACFDPKYHNEAYVTCKSETEGAKTSPGSRITVSLLAMGSFLMMSLMLW